jgi:hypothetical protein
MDETAVKILIVAGTIVLTYGFALGLPMAQARMKSATAPRHLVNVHLEALMAGATLLGLSIAIAFGTLPDGWEIAAAWMLALGVASTLLGGTLNWLMGAGDAFAEKTPGFYLQSLGGPLVLAGGVILVVSVFKGL